MAKTTIRTSEIHGHGLFAEDAIRPGETILKIAGKLIATDKMTDAEVRSGRWQGIAPGKALANCGSHTKPSFLNHSDTPNAKVEIPKLKNGDVPTLNLIALREIKLDEEITIDREQEPMDERCRRLIHEEIGKV
jgi:SET domain-containing protein